MLGEDPITIVDQILVATVLVADHPCREEDNEPENNLHLSTADRNTVGTSPRVSNQSARRVNSIRRAGNGTVVHLAAEMLKTSAGIDMIHVPYKGAGAAIADAVGGQVSVLFAVPGTALPHIKSGRLRALAVTGDSRFKSLPSIPTLAEAGVQGVGGSIIVGFVVPSKTPLPIVSLLRDTLAKVLDTTEVTDKLTNFGLSVVAADSEKSARMIADEMTIWGKVVKSSGAKVE